MGIDWSSAGQIGGLGFGLVFVVLIVLAAAIWLVGLVVGRIGAEKAEASGKKKGE